MRASERRSRSTDGLFRTVMSPIAVRVRNRALAGRYAVPMRIHPLLMAALFIPASVAVAGARSADETQPPAEAAPSRLPHEEVSEARLLAELRQLPTKRSAAGTEEHRAGLRKAEELLLGKLRALGYDPVTHDVDFLGSARGDRAEGQREPWRNIIVDIPGRTVPDEFIVFGAHFDAVPAAPGADDNGTGTVAVLEIARLLKDRPVQRSIRLCFFNLEEVGLVGSRAYVESIEDQIRGEPILDAGGKPTGARGTPAKKFLGMVSIDGVGYFTDEPNSQKSPIPETRFFKPPTVGDFIALGGILRGRHFSQALKDEMVKAAPELKVVAVDWLPIAPPDLLRSDHAPFIGAGVPACILADTANFRSPHYHQPTDTIDTLDMPRYTLVVKGLVGAAYALAGPVGEPLIELKPGSATPAAVSGETDNQSTTTAPR